MSRLRPFLAFVLGLSTSSSRAAERFVSPTGNDMAAGSLAAPFATIGKGVSAIKAGDTLTILPGEYCEAVTAQKLAGTADAPITIRAQRAGTVLMRGDVEASEWTPVAELPGVFSATFSGMVHGVADPRAMAHYSPAATVRELQSQPGAFFQEARTARLLVRTADAQPPEVLRISITQGSGLAVENCAHLIVDGLTFTGYQHKDTSTLHGSRTRWGFIAYRSEFITVRRCVAYLNSGGLCCGEGTRPKPR